MKKLITFALALGMIACTNAQWGKRVKGNGDYVTLERSVGEYDGVALAGWFDVELVSGTEGELTLEGESNLLEHIKHSGLAFNFNVATEAAQDRVDACWQGRRCCHGQCIFI